MPALYLNSVAILMAVLVTIAIGFLWYGPLFGNAWMKEMGVAPDFKPELAVLKRAMLLMVVGAVLTTLVLACCIEISRPTTWKAGDDAPSALYGIGAALLVWTGFHLPMLLGGVAWEARTWKWFGINAGFHLATLLAAGTILALWR